jgi:hypothetical protein
MQEITSDEITEKYKKLVEKHRVNWVGETIKN